MIQLGSSRSGSSSPVGRSTPRFLERLGRLLLGCLEKVTWKIGGATRDCEKDRPYHQNHPKTQRKWKTMRSQGNTIILPLLLNAENPMLCRHNSSPVNAPQRLPAGACNEDLAFVQAQRIPGFRQNQLVLTVWSAHFQMVRQQVEYKLNIAQYQA